MACCIAEALEVDACTIILNQGKSGVVAMGGAVEQKKDKILELIKYTMEHMSIMSQQIAEDKAEIADGKTYITRIGGVSFDKDWKPPADNGLDNLSFGS